MNLPRWRVVSPYLDRALEMEDGERAAFLASLGDEDPALAQDLRRLLDRSDALSDAGFLGGEPPHPPDSMAGLPVGAWVLVSMIGQGGMGSVWLARRDDGRFEGQAAVKLLNASLIGRAGERRFAREGSILARLTHPHIARLYDAGVTPEGQPYLVLELVDGAPIDRYCDEKALPVDARVGLFLDVLDAVQHAHANLVVHRDIKPSNVLVSRDGVVKLLDFGIAKLLELEAGDGAPTALTREGGGALTPEYAAPEQLTGGAITTATDVHALGTLLYVLLSGRHPAGDAVRSAGELVRAIVETEPRRPSDAAGREALRRALAGDLDTIVAKAMKKDPKERYASVTALADDLRRSLRHEPIGARPDTMRYRAAKFARRNRGLVAAAAIAVFAMAAGLAGTLVQARRATRAAALAEAQRRRADDQRDFALRQLGHAEAINDLNAFLLSDAAPSGKPFTAGELLARAEDIAERKGADTDENLVTILIAIGRQYTVLDQHDKGRRMLERAYEIARRLPDRSQGAKAACALATSAVQTGGSERAEKLVEEGLSALPPEPQYALDRVFCLLRGSEVSRESGDMKTGVKRAEEAKDVLKESGLGSALLNLRVSMDVAESYRAAGRLREAGPAFEETLGRLSALGRERTETAGTLLNNWALAVDLQGRHLEAERLYRRAVAISGAEGSEKNVSPMLLNNLARSLRDLGRLREAADYADRAYAGAKATSNATVVGQSLVIRASTYRLLGELDRSERMIDEADGLWKKTRPPTYSGFPSLASERAMVAQARGDLGTALLRTDEAMRLVAPMREQSPELFARILGRRANLELEMGFSKEAEADARTLLDVLEKVIEPGALSSTVGRASVTLGKALAAQGKLDAARARFQAAVPHLSAALGADHPEAAEARRLAA